MSMARRKGPLSAENGRRAANWGMTFGLVSVITAVIFFSLLFIPEDPDTYSGAPPGAPAVTWLVFAIVHTVLVIVAIVRAQSGRLVPSLGIPFFRAKGWHTAG